jgi:hypothetical protein
VTIVDASVQRFKYELDTLRDEAIGRAVRSTILVDGRMELLLTRPWFKSELDTRNLRDKSKSTAT